MRLFLFSMVAVILSVLLIAPVTVMAQTAGKEVLEGINETADQALISKGNEQDPTDNLAVMLGRTLNYLFGIVGTVFVTIILIGGYLWMAAGGNTEGVAKAKKFILNGIFGIMVISIAYALVFVILTALSGSNGLF